ncbi:MAG: T9SS type A sorting domain-containing protein [Fluviicola sp.]
MRQRFRIFTALLLLFILSHHAGAQTSYTTVTDGDWSDPATWGGNYVSSFFPQPYSSVNWFTLGMGDTIIINHNVTMDHHIFVRDPDVLVINSTGSLSASGANANALYVLSNGISSYTVSTFQAGLFVLGTVAVEYIRNSGTLFIDGTGNVTLTPSTGSGDFENFGSINTVGTIRLGTAGGDFHNNAGNISAFLGSLIHVQGGDFHNRSVIGYLEPITCIIAQNNFYNHAGGVVAGSGGFIGAVTGDIDNSSNPMVDFSSVSWCAGGAGINIATSSEECSAACSLILPVDLIEFTGKHLNGAIALSWKISSAANFSHFEVERFDVIQEKFVFQERLKGVSNTTSTKSYSYQDNTSNPAIINYYRLKLVDLDGSYTYSETVSVSALHEEFFQISPNPVVAGRFQISSSSVSYGKLILTDPFGKKIWEDDFTQVKRNFHINAIPNGIYWMQLFDENGWLQATRKVIFQ